MSLLQAIITSAEEINLENSKVRIPKLKSEVHLCKSEIWRYLEEVYVVFLKKPSKVPKLTSKLADLEKELSDLEQSIKKERISKEETLFEDVIESGAILKEIKVPWDFHEQYVDMKMFHSNEDYSKSLKILKELEIVMKGAESEFLCKYVRKLFLLDKSTMFHNFGELIKRKYVTALKEQGNYSCFRVQESLEVENVLQCFYNYDNHLRKLDSIINFLWKFIFVPVVTCIVKVSTVDNELIIHVTKRHFKQNYSEVFKKLSMVNLFLQKYLNVCLDKEKGVTLIEYMGNELGEKLSSLLITQCLEKLNPPNDSKHLDYDTLIKDTENLQVEFKSIKLVSNDAVLEYAKNLKNIHSRRQCDVFLKDAKIILYKNNADITQVGNKPDGLSNFPSMSISSNVQELLQLTEQMLMEIKCNVETGRSILFQTILNIFAYYQTGARKHYKLMVPQDVALFHNNCQYIAHEIREWIIFYSDIYIDVPTFKDEALQFHKIGEQAFNIFMKTQKNKLNELLIKSYTQHTNKLEDLSENSIRQCLNEIQYLKDSWGNILSQSLFNKSIGILLNVLCDFFIKLVLSFENIDRSTVNKISKIFDILINNGPSHFPETSDIEHSVFYWNKFQGLSFLLSSNLVEIKLKWNNEHSILKLNFTLEEMKRLIEALFEASKDKSELLSKLGK